MSIPIKSPSSHHQIPNSSPEFYPAISTVSTAQICLSVGYAAAEPAALRSLSRIASLYLRSLATSASSISVSSNRTDPNPLDVIFAIEDLSLNRGFVGASDPTTPIDSSPVVRDLLAFLDSVDEVPFAKKITRQHDTGVRVRVSEEGRGPPHVPSWLPGFPVGWRREESKIARAKERLRWEERIELGCCDSEESEIGVSAKKPCLSKHLPQERRIMFGLGLRFPVAKREGFEQNGRKLGCSNRVTTLYNAQPRLGHSIEFGVP